MVQSVERSVSQLLTEEEGRLAKKLSLAHQSGTVTTTADSCSQVWTTAADRLGLAKVPDGALLLMMRQAKACEAAQLDGPEGLPDPAASRAQMFLAVAGVDRLMGLGGTKN